MSESEQWMRRALELAERGRGYVEPNPLVGAVIARDGQVVGEGWHHRYGEAHAEVNALAAAGEAARGATLYVTLEPCCHHGKTPPCTDAVLRGGIVRVVAAMADPFAQVAGKGAEMLRAAGVPVELGLCETEAIRLNRPYLKLLRTNWPYVHAKWAMTLDGKIATRTGDSKWISNEAARQRVHELRGRVDAIVIGIHTVFADDPLMTARPPGPRIPLRVVLDSRARLPLDSRLVATVADAPVLVATDKAAPEDSVQALRRAGCEVLRLSGENGRPTVSALLDELGRRRMTNVLVEGGGAVLGNFLDTHCAIDEVHVFVAPRLVGGAGAKTPIAGVGATVLTEALMPREWHVETIEDNVYLHGLL
jgi:diaminohydroxyphosphoribosylaminopyrimidine deaminase/5-amino-6-(5-phosphoribosylamino)uracil reductase